MYNAIANSQNIALLFKSTRGKDLAKAAFMFQSTWKIILYKLKVLSPYIQVVEL